MTIFEFDNQKAKAFLLKHESYFDMSLPDYFDIEPLFVQLSNMKKLKVDYQKIKPSDNLHIDLYSKTTLKILRF